MNIDDLERWIRRDPARRGLLGDNDSSTSLCAGHLQQSAAAIAHEARSAAIITGFYVPDASPPSAETDGPLGALLLANVLRGLNIETCLITDEPCAHAIDVAISAAGMTETPLLVCPVDRGLSAQWRQDFWASERGRNLTHLISVERIGPAHSADDQSASHAGGAQRYLNMRGIPIDEWSADLDQLFIPTANTHRSEDQAARRITSIGIGDGGNEIGMGRIPMEELTAFRNSDVAIKAFCHVATDWVIVAGTSDWGAFALATATLLLRGEVAQLQPWTVSRMERILDEMVKHGPAVDGCTRRPQSTVDGLPLSTYFQPWMSIRRACGWHD